MHKLQRDRLQPGGDSLRHEIPDQLVGSDEYSHEIQAQILIKMCIYIGKGFDSNQNYGSKKSNTGI